MRFKKVLFAIAIVLVCGFSLASCGRDKTVHENVIYVSPEGDPEGTGSEADPTLFGVACVKAKPGTTILMEGGSYKYDNRIQITRSGTPNKYISVMPKNDKPVIFDFSEMRFDSTMRGIQLYGDFWYFKDIQVTGAGDNGMYVSGSYNIIESCMFYNNRDTGLQLGRGYSTDTSINDWPAYNLIKNCTSFANFDDETFGENADGFAAKLTAGYGNVFDGCIAFRNSDDGWDLYAKEDSGNIGTVILYNCVSFENGYLPYQIERTNDTDGSKYMSYNTMNGDGIGFKLGGSIMEGDVILNNCVAFNNKLHGFGDNSNPGVIDIRNCTAFNNCISLDEDGNVAGRGTEGGKSNNFDLARGSSGISKSYNNYYGLLSYVNNQSNFVADVGNEDDVELTYNSDKFRGSAAYSIFNTGYSENNKTENYVAFTASEDASVYASKANDITFSAGTAYTGLSDSIFAKLDAINAKCASVEELSTVLSKYHTSLRNTDMSVNLGDLLKVVDSTLLTFCNGSPIGANLSKSSYDEYPHYTKLDLSECKTADEVRVACAESVTEVLCCQDSVYQDFEIPKLIDGCDISWKSSNPDVAHIEATEKISVSDAAFSTVKIYTPDEDTKVTLTATIQCGKVKKEKVFDIIVKTRAQSMGGIAIEGETSIKVEKFGAVAKPRVYALDNSAIGTRELPLSLYSLSYTYSYAISKADTFYPVDDINTAVPGVYKVTATATSKIDLDKDNRGNYKTQVLSYYVYVLDKDCIIDFMLDSETGLPISTITMTSEGYSVGGSLSNLYGDLYSVYSPTELSSITAEQIINDPNVQIKPIEYDSISIEFSAGDLAGEQFYAYYVVANKNKSYISNVYSFSTNVIEVTNEADFYTLATTGKLGANATSTTIYKLTKDLDYSTIGWEISNAKGVFSGLFNGDGHTIKNINVEGTASKGTVVVFHKVQNGSIINTNFTNISLVNKNNNDDGKIVGIIGRLQGGYIYNVHMTNITARGFERVGALVGQCIGGHNFIEYTSLKNDENCTLAAGNKYVSGLVGEAECETEVEDKTIKLEFKNCMVLANLGDGSDKGGCHGGMLGRIKDLDDTFNVVMENCYYRGIITSFGNYNGGMIGDISNGNGTYSINGCYSDCQFLYKGKKLDTNDIVTLEDVQKYAHKNSNPLVGRASQVANVGFYYCDNNLGTWKEYYSSLVKSVSITFDMAITDEETGQVTFWTVNKDFLKNIGFDFDNVWEFNSDGTLSYKQ